MKIVAVLGVLSVTVTRRVSGGECALPCRNQCCKIGTEFCNPSVKICMPCSAKCTPAGMRYDDQKSLCERQCCSYLLEQKAEDLVRQKEKVKLVEARLNVTLANSLVTEESLADAFKARDVYKYVAAALGTLFLGCIALISWLLWKLKKGLQTSRSTSTEESEPFIAQATAQPSSTEDLATDADNETGPPGPSGTRVPVQEETEADVPQYLEDPVTCELDIHHPTVSSDDARARLLLPPDEHDVDAQTRGASSGGGATAATAEAENDGQEGECSRGRGCREVGVTSPQPPLPSHSDEETRE